MTGETDLDNLIKSMSPELREGKYVFATLKDISQVDRDLTLCEFKEDESTTIIIEKK